jgi:indolepyruvate ferredoxin oxidoreductase
MIARVIAARIGKFYTSKIVEARLKFLEAKEAALARPRARAARIPYFCSGCPHNTSTRVPEGSKALAGIGCHYMATWIRPEQTMTFTQMGGEGAPWIGIQPFTETRHVFANLGDGTYFHSGLLAIRAAASANVNLTYKILFNDAVAMTGGQPVDGSLTVPMVTRQVAAEGVKRIAIVSDEPEKYRGAADLAPGTSVHHRDELDAVQRMLREIPGVTALVYDQTCAAEKRRRRKRGTYPDPARRVVINERVCEGCGDCGAKSNCLSIVPVETEYGRKRAIDQSTCNKDYSCIKGFCPSFVTVEGGKLRKRQPVARESAALAEPALPALERPWGILVTGVGGTGVVTIGALLGVAAHIEGKGVAVLDMTGLAQKGGSVYSHIRIAARPEDIHAVRIAAGEAHAVIGCDMIVAASDEAIAKMQAGHTRAVVNLDVAPTGAFTREPDLEVPRSGMQDAISEACGPGSADFVEAGDLATRLLGDSIATNLFMVGYAWQKGLVPLGRESIVRAIELNGASVEANKAAFDWGRRAAVDIDAVRKAASADGEAPASRRLSATLDEAIARRRAELVQYQDDAYAARYEKAVARVREVESRSVPGSTALAWAVARHLFKLMAYKDEYEVARLYADGGFAARVASQFEGDYRLRVHLAPPLWSGTDPATGEPRKRSYGPWMLKAMALLAKFKGLRGTALDPFGHSAERREERRLIAEYEETLAEIFERLSPHTLAAAVDLASLPEHIRGFGPVKARHLAQVSERRQALLGQLRDPARSQRRPEIPVREAA